LETDFTINSLDKQKYQTIHHQSSAKTKTKQQQGYQTKVTSQNFSIAPTMYESSGLESLQTRKKKRIEIEE
jgi:hypothetical protein